jgi:GNAT superfamily N-acetyltransferase
LHVSWSDLAEIKSLAVAKDNQNQGVGAQLIKACLDEARKIGIPTVFCLTYQPAFFEKKAHSARLKLLRFFADSVHLLQACLTLGFDLPISAGIRRWDRSGLAANARLNSSRMIVISLVGW